MDNSRAFITLAVPSSEAHTVEIIAVSRRILSVNGIKFSRYTTKITPGDFIVYRKKNLRRGVVMSTNQDVDHKQQTTAVKRPLTLPHHEHGNPHGKKAKYHSSNSAEDICQSSAGELEAEADPHRPSQAASHTVTEAMASNNDDPRMIYDMLKQTNSSIQKLITVIENQQAIYWYGQAGPVKPTNQQSPNDVVHSCLPPAGQTPFPYNNLTTLAPSSSYADVTPSLTPKASTSCSELDSESFSDASFLFADDSFNWQSLGTANIESIPGPSHMVSPRSALKPTDVVLREYGYPGPRARLNIKRIALALVKQSYYGIDDMKRCTVEGRKKDLLQLDPVKLEEIRLIIRDICKHETDGSFDVMWNDIKRSIGKACNHLRRNSK